MVKLNLELEFRKINQKEIYWDKTSRLLLAVSGGVDSVVLLDLFERLPESENPHFAVAHVNHQLRKTSITEAAYLQRYCQERGIPYFEKKWSTGLTIKTDIENQARQFRYDFFSEVMKVYDYDALLTAHHQDDQAETILMKLVKGSQLQNLVGIREESVKKEQRIIRPFLNFSKEAIERTAKNNKLVYFNDETNQEDAYLRNRMRHQVIPLLKKENPQFLNHLSHFTQQIQEANEIISEKISTIFPKIITKVDGKMEWVLDLPMFLAEREGTQSLLLVELLQQSLIIQGVEIGYNQQIEILKILRGTEPQKQIYLQKGWRFERSYQKGRLWLEYQVKTTLAKEEVVYELEPNQEIYLNSDEWLACYEVRTGGAPNIPVELKDWNRVEISLSSTCLFPLTIRKRRAGDRFVFNAAGQKKQVKRYFIDQKIPAEKRLQSWIVTNQTKEILWIAPDKKSYLSIPKETDKIHYRLIYLKK